MARMKIIFDGFNELAEVIDKAGLDLHKAVDEALTETQKIIQTNLTNASSAYAHKGPKGYATGDMYSHIIRNADIEWRGTVASVRVGFDLRSGGGFHSIFIMYGTPSRRNNRGIAKDSKIYNAIRGVRTRKQIAEKQEEIMQRYLRLRK